jgi:hypothetical protein
MAAPLNTALFLVYIMPNAMLQASPSNPNDTQQRNAADMASTYVPLESWIYPAFDRLAAEGDIPDAVVGLRQWTRMDCAQLVGKAEKRIARDQKPSSDASTLLRSLKEYRLPGLWKCLTGYAAGFSDDPPFPVIYPTESIWLSGVFLCCLPGLPRMTVRAEGLLSPHRDLAFPGFFYFNVHYLSGYTNNRQLLGSWIGREGYGEQAWTTWNLSPRSSIEASFRGMTVNREFLQGRALRNFSLAANLQVRPEWQLRLVDQAEWWRFPLLSATSQRNNELTIQFSYSPIAEAKS